MRAVIEEPAEQPLDPVPLREISEEDLRGILEQHRRWVKSAQKKGTEPI